MLNVHQAYYHYYAENIEKLGITFYNTNYIQEETKLIEIIDYSIRECFAKPFYRDGENPISVPDYFQNFILSQSKNWTTSLGRAYRMSENINYLIKDSGLGHKIIVPIDVEHTGIIQENTQWEGGLHQFLQIKHGLKIIPLSLSTLFISNISYIQKYGKNIFGMTGTLGRDNSRKLLEESYKVETKNIPKFRKTQFLELQSTLTENEEEQINKIIQSTLREIDSQRAVLLISANISATQKINSELLMNVADKSKITLYLRNDQDQEI